jgi:hypothetical protein
MNAEKFKREFGKAKMDCTQLCSFIDAVGNFDAENRTTYSKVLSQLLTVRDDEPVAFPQKLFTTMNSFNEEKETWPFGPQLVAKREEQKIDQAYTKETQSALRELDSWGGKENVPPRRSRRPAPKKKFNQIR